jgi:hypothetical protein
MLTPGERDRRDPMRKLRALVGAVVAMGVVTGCGATPATPPMAVAPPVPVVEEDGIDPGHVRLLEQYWSERNAAFAAGVDTGVAFIADHLHPALGYSAEQCSQAWFGEEPPKRFRERSELHADTIVPAPDWTMDRGPLQGARLADYVYVMHLDRSYTGASTGVRDGRIASHLQVVRGKVRNFLLCEVPKVAAGAPPAVADSTGDPAEGVSASGVAAAPSQAAPESPSEAPGSFDAWVPAQPPAAQAPSGPAPAGKQPAAPAEGGGQAPGPAPDVPAEPELPELDPVDARLPEDEPAEDAEEALDFCLVDEDGTLPPGNYLACIEKNLVDRWFQTLTPQ